MKKIILALVAFMLVLGMTQCKKEQPTPTPEPTPDGETVYISMKVDDGGAKHIVYPGTGAYVFENGDVIYVGNNGKYVGKLTYANGTFSGSITNPSTTDYLHFYFTGGKAPATAPTAGSTTSFTVDISDQSSKLPVLSYGHSTTKYIDGTTAYTCMLENKCGLVKFVPTIATSEAISIGGMKTTATINFASGNEGIAPVDATGAVKLYAVNDSEKWALLLPQDQVDNPTTSISGYNVRIGSIPAVDANFYYSTGVEIKMVPEGAICGKYTINSNGDQVFFSQGNLQYQASTNTWRFAENQWNFVGGTPSGYTYVTGNVSGSDNCYISSTYNGWIDLFCWGTSGYDHGAVCYQPWSTSTVIVDYEPYGNLHSNLYDQTGQADWGYNPISNGGNQQNQWRTLSRAEWQYVLFNRTTTSGIFYAKAIVNDVFGVILLPDDWDASYYTLNNTNSNNVFFGDNNITASDWSTLELHGAVFLPTTGRREGTTVQESKSRGYYWTSSWYSSNYMNAVNFYHQTELYSNVSADAHLHPNQGLSVRLAQDVE